jgi:hypothetical protein
METTTPSYRGLRGLYIANIVGAGVPGALITVAPSFAAEALFGAAQEPMALSILGSVWLAIGLVSVVGLRAPRQLQGLFVVQLVYKLIWLLSFALPTALRGELRPAGWVMVGIFLFLIVGVALLIPLRPLVGARATAVQA